MNKKTFETGDFVRFVDCEKNQNPTINIFEVQSVDEGYVRLCYINKPIPLSEISPITIDGVEDRWIYYVPSLMAPFVGYGTPTPVSHTDYSYYMDALGRTTIDYNTTLKNKIASMEFKYVHEVQQYLRKVYKEDKLKINYGKTEGYYPPLE